jgi:DNA-binding IclR family transcriptional regulator
VNEENLAIAGIWYALMSLTGTLAVRCREIGDNCGPVLRAIRERQETESANLMMFNDVATLRIEQFMIANPHDVVSHARRLFSAYQTTGSFYSVMVDEELQKLCQLMELMPELIDRQWARTSLWLWGPRSDEVRKHLTRACEGLD